MSIRKGNGAQIIAALKNDSRRSFSPIFDRVPPDSGIARCATLVALALSAPSAVR